ncbi:MAG: DUF362 domain-containing protein [Bacteroidales bacterium]|nr:DUF362 domain-containing protein [Bacteroidales bacterium]
MTKKTLTRRKLIKNGALASIGGYLYLNSSPARAMNAMNASQSDKSRVVLIRDKDILNGYNKPDPDRLQSMLDRALLALTGKDDIVDAWKGILKPEDILGIKTNVWNYLPTPSELEQAIKKRAMDAGLQEKNIGIKDRGITNDDIFQNATALINTRPLRTHAWSGVGSLIKNYIMFIPNPSSLHGDSCADLATLWKLPVVEGKTRLNILVMLNPLFHGVGRHHFSKKYTWEYNGLLVGFDPVAVDATGISILQAKRKEYFGEDRPLNPPAKHIFLADTRHKLGTADPSKIELVKLGWQENCLI